MAESTKGGSKGASKATAPLTAPDEERVPTRRVILKHERVIVVPEGVATVNEKTLREALGVKDAAISIGEAWVVVDEQEGSQREAIEAYAGEPNTPDAKPGDYKAPPLRGWKGGERYVRPERPKVERQALPD